MLLIFLSCNKNIESNRIFPTKETDLVKVNYDSAFDKANTKSYEERLLFINKAYGNFRPNTQDSLKENVLNLKTFLHSKTKEIDSAIFFSKELLRFANEVKDSGLIGKSHFKMGLYNYKLNRIDTSYYHYNESRKIFKYLNDSVQVGRRYLSMAILLSDVGDYISSDELAIEGLKYLQNTNDKKTIASLENCLAISAVERLDYEDALIRYDKAINSTPSKKNMLVYKNNKANVFIEIERYQLAISLFDLILENKDLDIKFKAKVEGNLAYAKWLLTRDIVFGTDIETALNVKKEENDLFGQIISYSHLSEFYKGSNAKLAREYAVKMYELATQLNSVDDKLIALRKVMELNEQAQDYTMYSKIFVRLTDSLKEVRYNASNKFAKIRFESEKRKAEISTLKATSAERQLNMERAEKSRDLAGILIVALLIIGFLVYKSIKAKFNKEKIEQVYQTETNISKKIHDEIANDVYNTMAKLQSQGFSNNEMIVDDLDNIYVRAREISREHGSIDFEEEFESILHDLFLNFKSDDVNVITRGMNKIKWSHIEPLKRATIYRVLQELLVNSKKHSEATMITVSFKLLRNRMLFEYVDNGVGCDMKKKNGLLNVENRIKSFNGSVNFESEINKGFKAIIEV